MKCPFPGGGGFLFNRCLHRACPAGDSNDRVPGMTIIFYLKKNFFDMILLQYNMEAEGLGQRPAVGVTTFKKRNSEKRAGWILSFS